MFVTDNNISPVDVTLWVTPSCIHLNDCVFYVCLCVCSLFYVEQSCVFVFTEIMVVHKEFQTAGKQPGLQVWRLEKMDLVPVPKQLHGNFYIGDAYILLYTTPAPAYAIHMWLGETLSQSLSVCPHI